MSVFVSGSSGHLGEALMRTFRASREDAVGLDRRPSTCTSVTGSITDRELVREHIRGATVVHHTATLHKPHVATHAMEAFVETNVRGTLVLLEEAVREGVEAFVFTSTTSVFGNALRPPPGSPAVWVTEDVRPVPPNIHGVTKEAAENLCRLFHRKHGLRCIILRTSRFFPEEDDDAGVREAYAGENAKVNELLHRRVDVADVVSAHMLAAEKAREISFGRYIVSATAPFSKEDLDELGADAPAVVRRCFPQYEDLYRGRRWRMFPRLDRVYVNQAARRDLGWAPRLDFSTALARLAAGEPVWSELARAVGSKGYHDEVFDHGPYPVE